MGPAAACLATAHWREAQDSAGAAGGAEVIPPDTPGVGEVEKITYFSRTFL